LCEDAGTLANEIRNLDSEIQARARKHELALLLNHRAQSRREQSFGESLRDQLNRSIGQLDDAATRARRTSVLVMVLLGGICT
jgi:hypothetical protein